MSEEIRMTWDDYYCLAKEYYLKNGNLLISQKYVTESGIKLGEWIHTQRRAYNGTSKSKINEDQILKLNSIGMVWRIKDKLEWEESFSQAQKYYFENGDLLVPFEYTTSSGYNLGIWISEQRSQYKRNNLSPERIGLLNSIGMVWQVYNGLTWDESYKKARNYFLTIGDLLVPQSYIDNDGFTLGIWISNQRLRYKSKESPLTDKQIDMLNEIGMVWNIRKKRSWEFYYEYALQYYEQHLNLLVPISYEIDGVKLGNWIANQRRNRKANNNKISEYQIELLDNIDMVWEVKQRTVSKKD